MQIRQSIFICSRGNNAQSKDTPLQGKYTVFHEIILNPGEQYTLPPDTKHWFKADINGAGISGFSTKSVDEADIFTDESDERIVR